MNSFRKFPILILAVMSASLLAAQAGRNRYAVILEDSPVAAQFSRERMALAEGANYTRSVEQRQQTVRGELARRGMDYLPDALVCCTACRVHARNRALAKLS